MRSETRGKRLRVHALLLLAALILGGCSQDEAPPPAVQVTASATNFQADNSVWRQQRQQALLQPDGWTSLVGLFWLQPGRHRLGSGADNDLRLEQGPVQLGELTVTAAAVWFRAAEAESVRVDGRALREPLRLYSDHDAEGATTLEFDHGKGRLSLIRRGQRMALRVRHADAASRRNFTGLSYWPADPSWRIQARYLANPPGTTLPIVDIVGSISAQPNPGVIEFERDGRRYRLQTIGASEQALFVVFADRSNGRGSYPAGRFIDLEPVDGDGRVVIDFNRAYNPPCAFTAFATCPLPPPQNRLDLAVTAGEKRYQAGR